MSEQYFSPAETAARLGVTVKALRVYERHGLVQPQRTAAGWRAYGATAFAQLHQVLALKRLGLSLARIAELLRGGGVDMDAVLALQERAMVQARDRAEHALGLIAAARSKLRAGEALTVDDLSQLTKEVAMSDDETMKQIFDPLAQRHFSPEELKGLEARQHEFDPAESAATWGALMAECKALMEKGDPTSPEAMDLAGRWMAQVAKFTGGDPGLFAKAGAIWKDAMADPAAAPKLPMNPEMFGFIARAEAARKAMQG